MKANLNFNSSSQRGNIIHDLRYGTSGQGITIYNSQQAELNEESNSINPFGNLNYSYVKDPISEIENCTGVLIKQYPDSFNFVNGCEACNKYYIFGVNQNNYKYLFKCEENIDCFMNIFCPMSNKKLIMNLIHISSNSPSSQGVKVGNITKPYSCTCCCFCTPELILSIEDSNEIIGKIKEDFSCCYNDYKLKNIKNENRYLVTANCCQCGLCFSNSICGNNCDVSFSIEEPITHEQLGVITKQLIGDKKNGEKSFEIKFPRNANSNDKLLLTALGIMIDYQFFEVDPNKFKDNINQNKA